MNKTKLSKFILEMKFMKKTKEKVEKEEDDAEGRALYSSEITDKMLHGQSNFIIEPSFVPCENLIEGRVSYRGMNPEIERIMEIERYGEQQVKERERLEREKEMTKDVSDKDMAKFYGSIVKTMEKKYKQMKRLNIQPTKLKKELPLNQKFKKPNYDD
uniref:Putative cytoplasm n=1 Tax=Corethrella appendiculata TaxID=1370023 RepID=U5ESH4_9DIPT